jgi:hypothetical protein
MLSEVLQARQTELGLTNYAIAKAIAEKRGGNSTPTTLSSSITKVMKEPDGRNFALVREVVEMLGGKIVIQWQKVEEIEV